MNGSIQCDWLYFALAGGVAGRAMNSGGTTGCPERLPSERVREGRPLWPGTEIHGIARPRKDAVGWMQITMAAVDRASVVL